MNRPGYNSTVREILYGLCIGIDDCVRITNGREDFVRVIAEAAYYKYDALHYPITQCAHLLDVLYGFISPAGPSAHALYHLLHTWRATLLADAYVAYEYQFSRELRQRGIHFHNHLKEYIYRFLIHVKRSSALIRAVLDFQAPQEVVTVDPVMVPVFAFKELRYCSPPHEQEPEKRQAEPVPTIDEHARVALELEHITYEDRFGKRMQVDIAKKNNRIRHLRELQATEHSMMLAQDAFSRELSAVYRRELAERADERRIRGMVTDTVRPSLGGLEQAVVYALNPLSRRK